MTHNHAPSEIPTPLAVVHRAGGLIRAVIGGPARPADLAAWNSFSDDERLAAWLDEQGVAAVIEVLPASAVICRTCTLPDAEPEALAQALALQAEAHMTGDTPPHRQARAVLPISEGETSRSGIMVAWPRGNGDIQQAAADAGGLPVTYAPDVAGLAALLNGQRPNGPLLWFDPVEGCVSLVISHPNGAVLRSTRVSAAGSAADAVGPVIAETALSVNHSPEFTRELVGRAAEALAGLDERGGLVAPPELLDAARQRLAGSPDDPRWWGQYGIAAGVLLAAAGELASLTGLRREAPSILPSRGRKLIDALSNPRAATRIVVICAAIVLLGPVLLAGMRLGILKVKLPDLNEYLKEAKHAEVQLAMYRELTDRTWPMTKLLSDVACNTPEAIDVDQIRIRHGERVTVTGRSRPDRAANLSAQEVVAQMQDNLRQTGIFEEIYLNWGDPNNFGAYEFTLSAKVINPYRAYKYPIELDYGEWTLGDRLYGDGRPSRTVPVSDEEQPQATPDETPDQEPVPGEEDVVEEPTVTAPEASVAAGPRIRERTGPLSSRDGDVGARGRAADRSLPGGSRPASQDVPDPITQEQVDVMSLAEAQEAYTHLSQALQQARVEEDVRQRLWNEWRMVRDRVRTLKRGGGSQ